MTDRPLVTNSLFNVTFEAEDSSPALVPIALDDDLVQEIKNDIDVHLPPTTVPVPVQSTNIYNSTEIERTYSGDVAPIDVFRNYTNHGTTMDPFSSVSLLNTRETQPSALLLPGQISGTTDFLTGPPLVSFKQQEISHNSHDASLPETSTTANATISDVPTITNFNETNYFKNGRFDKSRPPPTESYYIPPPTGSYYIPPPNIETSGISEISTPLSRPPTLNESYTLPSSETENHFRLGSSKPVYAKYPGFSDTMGGSHGLPPSGPPLPTASRDSTHNNTRPSVFSPVSSFHCTTENGPGYSFGEPIPVPSSQSYQQYHVVYKPVAFHWFYRVDVESRTTWKPFSYVDSKALEEGYKSNPEKLVPTDGGRCDVDVQKRLRKTIYWEEDVQYDVRRSSWFYKGPMDSRFIPYDEEFSQHLEKEYEQATVTGEWHKRLDFDGGEAIILQSANSIVHFCQAASPDEWGNLPESQLRPRVVKRGVEDFEIDYGEPTQVDHLVFLVHGIGAICDFKFRSITEAVDDFRNLSVHMMHSHFREAVHTGRAGRVEFLPVSWHKSLHSDGGIDKKLKPITLPSIPKLRHFTNDTLLDILFYTSPVYCQTIVDTVAREMNRMYNLFLGRNKLVNGKPFNGKVSLGGHSLGSVILFDLLAHQKNPIPEEDVNAHSKILNDLANSNNTDPIDILAEDLLETSSSETALVRSPVNRTPSYTVVSGGTGQPFINYPTLDFNPTAFFAMGSPTAMFVTVRGLDELGADFHFPTCPAFFNIFHPYDPVAYRMESLIDQNIGLPPVMIPHHKGRKRFHLELKDTVTRVSADLKNKFLESIRTTWNTVSQLTHFGRAENANLEIDNPTPTLEDWSQSQIVDKQEVILQQVQEIPEQEVRIGLLNRGRRIDYVLQEAPVEILNEYLFALTSHVCYWESEDVSLFLLKELYGTLDIFEDVEVTAHSPVYATLEPVQPTSYSTPDFDTTPVAPQVNVPLLTPQDVTSSKVDIPQIPPTPSVPKYYSSAQGYGSINRISRPYIPFPDGRIQPNNSGPVAPNVYGMDPTVPMATPSSIMPPPLSGFVSKG